MTPVLIGITVYVLIQLAIGLLMSRRIRNEADYLLAGRSLGLGLATFSVFATWFGAETVVGAAGSIYEHGLSGGAADPFGYAACLLLMGLFFAVPLWRRGLTTLADLFRSRYSPTVERVAVLLIVPTSVMWAAAQIRAFGQVIAAASSFEVEAGILIATTVVIMYTVYGGLLADVMTDFIQGIALIVGLSVLFWVVIDISGGWQAAAAGIQPEQWRLFGSPDEPLLVTLEKWAIPITGSVVAQELISRILACRSPQTAQRAALLGGGIYLAVGLIPAFIGLIGVRLLPGLEEPEQLLPQLAAQYLPTFLYIVFAGALISAILSTVDSALLAASALVEHNLVVPLRPRLGEAAKVRIARGGVAVFGVIAYLLALQAEGIYQLVVASSALGGAGIFIIVMFGLFTRFGGPRAALAALATGLAVWLGGEYLIGWPLPYLSSLAAAFFAYVLVALTEHAAPARSPDPSKP
jgi:SSS family transporter